MRHPDPPPTTATEPWTFRRADLDVAGHVNNAAYWAVLEEELTGSPPPVAEIEFRGGAEAGPAVVCRAGPHTWICASTEEIHASIERTMPP
ncbi:MAG: hypothetical protein ACR2NB_15620 [Solirubrobacteraceae bacterium]